MIEKELLEKIEIATDWLYKRVKIRDSEGRFVKIHVLKISIEYDNEVDKNPQKTIRIYGNEVADTYFPLHWRIDFDKVISVSKKRYSSYFPNSK